MARPAGHFSHELDPSSLDSPAVVVVGRQTDGKSALIEALMGFQFNHVGGGTKTRKPVTFRILRRQPSSMRSITVNFAQQRRPVILTNIGAKLTSAEPIGNSWNTP